MTPPFAAAAAPYQPRHAARDVRPVLDPAIAEPYDPDLADRFIASSRSLRVHLLALLARFRRWETS